MGGPSRPRTSAGRLGAGYASFHYLRHLPVRSVKTDGEVVRGILTDRPHHGAVRATLSLADDMRQVHSNTRSSAEVTVSGGDGRVVANRDQPTDVPPRPMGEVPVIVRVAWEDGAEEWRAAKANRWTATHVMVSWRDDPKDPRTERYEWLRAQDVMRSVSWLVAPVGRRPSTPRGERIDR